MFKFYIAFYIAKIGIIVLKILGRNASFFPGKVAIKICPDFLKRIDKPKTIIGVTGTNGKTTVCNLIINTLKKSGYKILDNGLGANINAGIATTFLSGATIFNKTKYEIGVLEIDERSSPKVFPYVKPTYLVCTNLFRDSIRRNAHAEFILDIINKNLPKETKLILNADDLISSSLGINGEEINARTYFAIDKLDTDLKESINIINDMRICPKCHTKLKYNYVRYHHIGNAYCPNCNFKSPEASYRVTKIDYENNKMIVKHNEETLEYGLISNSIFNIYNMLAAITVLSEIGVEKSKIQENLSTQKIVESRYQKENVNGINIITHMAKGQNPIACSCVFDYVKKEKGKKEIVLILYDLFEAKESSENLTWIYDCDFEFLNSQDIEKIVIAGPRCYDFKLRLLIAGVPEERLICEPKEINTVNHLSLDKNKDIYILYEMYDDQITNEVRQTIKDKINGGDK